MLAALVFQALDSLEHLDGLELLDVGAVDDGARRIGLAVAVVDAQGVLGAQQLGSCLLLAIDLVAGAMGKRDLMQAGPANEGVDVLVGTDVSTHKILLGLVRGSH
jgi:hypothetical protein